MRKYVWIGVVWSACSVGICLAEGYRNPPSDVAALGRSGAGYTRSGDVGVLAFTPAQVLSLTNRQAELNISLAKTDIEHRALDGVKTENDSEVFALPNLFANFPINPDLTVGLSLTTPYGQGSEYDRKSRFAAAGPYRAQLTMLDLAPTLAWRAQDWLWLSVGVDLYVAELELDQNIPWTLFGAPAGTPPGIASVESDGEEIGFTLSAVLHPKEGHALTATYRHGMDMDFSGDFTTTEAPGPSPLSRRSSFDTTIRFPHLLALGYGVEVTEQVQVEVYVEFQEWSRNESIVIDGGANQLLIPGPIVNNWDDTVTYGVGASWQSSEELVFHTGYSFIETPIPDATLTPLLVDSDRHAFSLGCSWGRGAHHFDLSGTLSIHDDRNISRADAPLISGQYETTSTLVGIAYTYIY